MTVGLKWQHEHLYPFRYYPETGGPGSQIPTFKERMFCEVRELGSLIELDRDQAPGACEYRNASSVRLLQKAASGEQMLAVPPTSLPVFQQGNQSYLEGPDGPRSHSPRRWPSARSQFGKSQSGLQVWVLLCSFMRWGAGERKKTQMQSLLPWELWRSGMGISYSST